MKKIYFFVFSLLLLAGRSAYSQCTFSSTFGSATINTAGTVVTISTCSFAGEYSTISGAVNGQTLQFTFSNLGTGAYITVHSGTSNGPIVASGNSPLSFANTFTGTLYAHWSLNAACGTDGSCHTTTVQCTSCTPPPPAPCTNASSFGSATINPAGALVTISTCSFAGEYSTISGAVNGQTLRFTSSVASDNITIHSGSSAGPVLAFGTTPLTFANTFTGTIYAHWNTPGCGSESACRTTTVQCTSCVLPPPVNDLCTGALTINCGQTIAGSTSAATIDAAAPTCITGLNTAPGVWYTFVGDGQLSTLSLCGSGYDTKIGVYTGTCASLVCVTGNDDFCGLQSQVGFVTTIGTTYYVLVTGFSTNSGAFTLTRTCTPAIPNDVCTGAININCGQIIAGSTVGAGTDAVGTCGVNLSSAPGIWYTFVGTGTDNILSLCGSSYDTEIGIFTGSCGSLICVGGNDDFCGLQSQITIPNTVFGQNYYILVTGFSTGSGAFSLTRTCLPPPNDACANAITINCGQSITGSTALATTDAVPTCVTALNTAPGVWYKFVGDASPVTLSLCTSLYDTKIGVFTGTCGALTCVTGNDDFAGCGTRSQVTFNTNAGFTYYILVTGFSTNTGVYTLVRTCAPACSGVPSPGSITPVTSTVCRNAPVTLTASGFSPNSSLAFQWSSAPAAAGPYTTIPGANSNVYSFNPTVTAYYTVTVTCTSPGGGSGTTLPVVVNVDGISHINVSATPSTVCQGGSTVITGTAINGITLSSIAVIGNSGTINMPILDNNPTGSSNSIAVSTSLMANPSDLRIRVNMQHTWVGDISIQVTSPCGQTFLFDRPGVPASGLGNADDINGVYTFDVGQATIIPEASVGGLIPAGGYIPSDAGGSPNTTWAALGFPCSAAGTWTLKVVDFAGGDAGTIFDWQVLGPLPSNYTHTLTGGGGTITQNPSTGVANATGNFTVTNLPAGTQTFTLTSTDPFGCSVSSPVVVTVNPTPVIVFNPTSATICAGQVQQINAYATPGGATQTFNSGCTMAIPGTGTGPGQSNPYPCTLSVAGLPPTGVVVKNVTINNYDHSFPDDVDLLLVSPTGTQVLLMSDVGGAGTASGQNFTFQDGAPAMLDNAFNNTGTYSCTNFGVPDAFNAPLGSVSQATPLLSNFTGNANGNWQLYAMDDAGGNTGIIGSWSITFNVPSPVVFTPITGLFLDAGLGTPYTGTPVYTVYASPAITTTYTGNASSLGCPAVPATITVTVNQKPAITTQPTPATQTICPGFTVTYTGAASGTGPLTYQWQFNPGSGFVNLVNGGFISGANTPTLTIANVQVANAGTYQLVVTGICAPPATSNPVVLIVGSAPTITTQPVNTTVCETGTATFSVVAAGVPTPGIYQWQQSIDGGTTWTNLTTGGSYTPTLTLTNVTLTMNGYRYRVLVTNSCGMTLTSNVAILTVNAKPVVTATPLPTRICLSDTLVPLVGSPTGGSWSGIGVSGFNFVPTATAVGTYTLTYTFTSAAGCTNTAVLVAKVEDCPERIRTLTQGGVIVYPNPNNGHFSFRVNSTLYNYLGMKVYDMAGRLVNGKVVKNGTDQALVSPTFTGLVYGRVIPVDLSYLPSGTYLVKFYYDDGIRSSEKGFLVVILK